MPHFFIGLILYVNILNLSWITMFSFEEYGAFKELKLLQAAFYLFILFIFFFLFNRESKAYDFMRIICLIDGAHEVLSLIFLIKQTNKQTKQKQRK